MPSVGNPVGKWQLMISRDIVEFKSDGTVTRSDSGQSAVEPDSFSPLKRGESARWEAQGDKLTFISKDADGRIEKMTFEYSIGTRSGNDAVLNIEDIKKSKKMHGWMLEAVPAQPSVGGDGKPAPKP
jgi:hypothetical protein